jgi:hypothetical protein
MTFFMLVAGHYLPWHLAPGLVDKRGDLRRTVAYAYGTICIFIGFAARALSRGEADSIAWLAGVTLVAGAGTILPRVINRNIDRRAEIEELKERHGASKH